MTFCRCNLQRIIGPKHIECEQLENFRVKNGNGYNVCELLETKDRAKA